MIRNGRLTMESRGGSSRMKMAKRNHQYAAWLKQQRAVKLLYIIHNLYFNLTDKSVHNTFAIRDSRLRLHLVLGRCVCVGVWVRARGRATAQRRQTWNSRRRRRNERQSAVWAIGWERLNTRNSSAILPSRFLLIRRRRHCRCAAASQVKLLTISYFSYKFARIFLNDVFLWSSPLGSRRRRSA